MAKTTAKKQIKEGKAVLAAVMRDNLIKIGYPMIDTLIKRYKNSTDAQKISAVKDIPQKGVSEYKSVLKEIISEMAVDAVDLAKSEIPGAKKISLAMDDLPASLRKKILAQIEVLMTTQMMDIEMALTTAYLNNYATTDSAILLEEILYEFLDDYIEGTSVEAGAFITASTTVAQARDEVFNDDDISDLLDALMFVNGDPQYITCVELAGTVFEVDDPDRFYFTPPLHWNCQSYIQPIPKGALGKREIEKLDPSKKAREAVKFEDSFRNALMEIRKLTTKV